jgi:hypothetical protein
VKALTEAEWQQSTDLDAMLRFLTDRTSRRKKRLFGCACARAIWPLLGDERSRHAVEVSERHADGLASAEELERAALGAQEAHLAAYRRYQEALGGPGTTYTFPGPPPPWEAPWRAEQAALTAVCAAAVALDDTEGGPWQEEWRPVFGPHGDVVRYWLNPRQAAITACYAVEERAPGWPHGGLLHCLFGNPFRPPTLHPAWLTATVVPLARAIYEARDFPSLPILADALEEAGCDQEGLLAHCRQGGEHALGCHVLDLLLGKG